MLRNWDAINKKSPATKSGTHPAEKKRPAVSGCTRSGGPMWSKGRSVCGFYVVREKLRPPLWAAALMRRTSVLRLRPQNLGAGGSIPPELHYILERGPEGRSPK